MENKAQDDDLVMNMVELALDLPERERRAYLERACDGDSQLFDQAWEYVQWEARMQGFLLDPLYPPPLNEHPFEPGQLLEGRFRILREVAQGGMGVVYEAMDERLERRIAIKCAKTGFRKRLPPEVRNAREVSHPNVCKIFEIHTASTRQGDLDFLSMEFIDGQTLAERLRRGALPESEARLIARQLCEGLAEAHRNQVIHGDLKSNNIILTTNADGSTRAVITDFGLARRRESSQRTMQTGPLGGTPDYMVPELWKGEKASAASDIYALGVILYELVSGGRPPQPQDSAQANFPPPAAHPQWDRTLAGCLEPDPSRRFRTADEVARTFEPSLTRRRLIGLAAALVLAVASAVFAYERATAPQESVRLALLPFLSTPDSTAIAESVVRDGAAQVGRLKGNRRTRFSFIPLTTAVRNKVDTPEKARASLGATHVLRGTLEKDQGRLRLHVFLTDTRTRVNTKDWTVVYAPEEVRYAGVALAGMVSGTLLLPPLLDTATVNAAARPDYEAGLSLLSNGTTPDDAIVRMQRAAAADQDSTLVFAGLAEAYWAKYLVTSQQLARERSEEALRQAELRNLDLPEVHLIAGLVKASVGLYEQAVADFQRVIEIQPNNGDAYRRLGIVYGNSSQLDEALTAFRRAIAVQPQNYRNYRELGSFYVDRDDYVQAVPPFKRMIELVPQMSDAHFGLGTAYLDSGHYPEAENELRIAIGLGDTSDSEHTLAYLLMLQGKDNDAIPHYLKALEIGPETALLWLNLGISYERTGLSNKATSAFRHGLAVAERDLTDPRNGRERADLAYLAAKLGDRPRAASEIAQALQLWPDHTETRWMAALTYEALGRRDDTLGLLARSPAGMVYQLNRYPEVADLRRDSRFLQILASKHVQ